MLMQCADSQLLVIDMQERLLPAMCEPQRLMDNTLILMQAAQRLEVPLTVSEQYPKGLGPSVAAIAERASGGSVVEKVHFSCAAAPEVRRRLDAQARGQLVLAGIEAHVCVLQSALGLRAAGKEVFVVVDAISSRAAQNKVAGVERMRAAGVHIVSTEMVVFEWLHRASTPEFKQLSALIK